MFLMLTKMQRERPCVAIALSTHSTHVRRLIVCKVRSVRHVHEDSVTLDDVCVDAHLAVLPHVAVRTLEVAFRVEVAHDVAAQHCLRRELHLTQITVEKLAARMRSLEVIVHDCDAALAQHEVARRTLVV